MNLIEPNATHLSELLTWVKDKEQLAQWAGSNMRYPCCVNSLAQDLAAWPSFALASKDQELLGFGQYYLRLGHCHLCRLIVSPRHRGKGLVQKLIEMISIEGTRELGVNSCSLFVYRENTVAIKAYQKIGFISKDYPASDVIDDCLYMVISLDDVLALDPRN